MVKSMKNLLTMKKMMVNIIERGARMNEKQIDDYIDSMEEKNAIYVESELDYASKCHNLEEQIGCPLEVIIKAQVCGFYGETKEEEFCFYNPVEDFIIIDFRLGRIQVALSMDFYNVITFYLSDYKKTWFLRKDKSE